MCCFVPAVPKAEGCVSELQGCLSSPQAAHPLTEGFEKITLLSKVIPSAMQKGKMEHSILILFLQERWGQVAPADVSAIGCGSKAKSQREGSVQLLFSKKMQELEFLRGRFAAFKVVKNPQDLARQRQCLPCTPASFLGLLGHVLPSFTRHSDAMLPRDHSVCS